MKTEHTEDCLDANDDTSVLKGHCICPKREQHTPTPWKVESVSPKEYSNLIIRSCGNNPFHDGIIADIRNWGPDNANAKFIVMAVNAHEELLEACKAAKDYFVNFDGVDPLKVAKLMMKVTQAIAKAEGKY